MNCRVGPTNVRLLELVGGQIDLAFDNVPLLLPHVKAGGLVALATATKDRAAFDPDLPAVSERVPGFEAVAWHGFLAPAATPKDVIERLAGEIGAFMNLPGTKQRSPKLALRR